MLDARRVHTLCIEVQQSELRAGDDNCTSPYIAYAPQGNETASKSSSLSRFKMPGGMMVGAGMLGACVGAAAVYGYMQVTLLP